MIMRARSLATVTDFYEFTMAECYHRHLPDTWATFDLFVRQLPEHRSFLIAAGVEDILDFLEDFRFTPDDIGYLRGLGVFSKDFVSYLKRMRFTGDVWAMPEGTVFFPNEPVVRVTAPIQQAQLVEGFLLNTVNLQSMIASKAARVVLAAGGRPVYDFSLRRTHGYEASVKVARSAYLAGFTGTSNVLAGKEYGIPLSGTMAHSFVMAFGNETDSFSAYAGVFPDRTVLLVDTYDVRAGIDNAVAVAKKMLSRGHKLLGIRIDSGDIVSVSRFARRRLDNAGLKFVKIVASGNLDEFAVERLLRRKAAVDSFGVGTHIGTSSDAPVLDVIYKLSEVTDKSGEFLPAMKLSKAKVTLPGRKQVFRFTGSRGGWVKDVLALETEKPGGRPLLRKVFAGGRRLVGAVPLKTAREYARGQLASLPASLKRITGGAGGTAVLSRGLRVLTRDLSAKLAARR